MKKYVKLLALFLCIAFVFVACGSSENSGIDNENSQAQGTGNNTSEIQDVESENGDTEDSNSEETESGDAEDSNSEEIESESQEEVKPTYTYTELNMTMYATNAVNLRSGPSTAFSKIGQLARREEVQVTGKCIQTGWFRIAYDGGVAYVSANYLSNTQPSSVTYYDTGDADLNALCDDILDEIVDSSMSEREKAYAVYTWTTNNIRYSGSSDTSSWVKGAKTALTSYKGNCYAFYSASRALLTRLGYANAEATSIDKDHYWNLVKVEGTWWHFDTTTGWGTERFLWTNDQINEYQYYSTKYNRYIDYDWDQKGIPE